MPGVLIKGKDREIGGTQTQTMQGKGHRKSRVEMDAETAGTLPQAEECPSPLEAGRGEDMSSPGAPREVPGPADTLMSDFQPPEPCDDEHAHFIEMFT